MKTNIELEIQEIRNNSQRAGILLVTFFENRKNLIYLIKQKQYQQQKIKIKNLQIPTC